MVGNLRKASSFWNMLSVRWSVKSKCEFHIIFLGSCTIWRMPIVIIMTLPRRRLHLPFPSYSIFSYPLRPRSRLEQVVTFCSTRACPHFLSISFNCLMISLLTHHTILSAFLGFFSMNLIWGPADSSPADSSPADSSPGRFITWLTNHLADLSPG